MAGYRNREGQLAKVFKEQRSSFVSICGILIKDALIFCIWLLIAWGMNTFAVFFAQTDEQAELFRICSSYGTLAIACIFILIDIVKACKELIKEIKTKV